MKRGATLFFIIVAGIFLARALYAGKTPDIVKLDSLVNEYEPVVFNHATHTFIAGDCGKCHHQHGNSGALPCKDCHSVAPSNFKNSVVNNFMACKNCHGTYNPSVPRMPGLKVAYHQICFQCHRGMGNVGTDPKGCAMMCHAKKEHKAKMMKEK